MESNCPRHNGEITRTEYIGPEPFVNFRCGCKARINGNRKKEGDQLYIFEDQETSRAELLTEIEALKERIKELEDGTTTEHASRTRKTTS